MPTTTVLSASGFDIQDWSVTDFEGVAAGNIPTYTFNSEVITITFASGRSLGVYAAPGEPFTGTDFTDAAGTIAEISFFRPGADFAANITDFGGTVSQLRTAVLSSVLAGNTDALKSFFFDRAYLFNGGAGTDIAITGNAANTLIGNGGADELNGSISFDVLSGGSGSTDETFIDDGFADLLVGGDDSDTYYVGTDDGVTENAGQGDRDEMRSYLDTTIASNVEILRLIGTTNVTASGNISRNILHGNSGHNQLFGFAGDDDLFGGDGDDRLAGGADVDSMTGGNGNDTYEVGSALDKVVEAAGAGSGIDVIIATTTFTMTANTEMLWLTGSANINGTGKNDSANGDEISGNAGDNQLTGLAGADKLIGNGGGDTLDGGTGADTMEGGAGNDIYDVDNSGDSVKETLSGVTGGDDWVFSSVSFTLGANLEELYLEDAVAAIRATGNNANNRLVGNKFVNEIRGLSGADHLDGLAGADSMYGGDGNDTYIVDNGSDKVFETSASLAVGGNDTVHSKISYTLGSNIENLLLLFSTANGTGNALANSITGNAANNVLYGLDGLDTIKGMAGSDWIVGGKGGDDLYAGVDTVKDTFQFLTYQDSATNAANLNALDWIIEFKRGSDKIHLSTLDANANVAGNQDYKLDTNGDFKAGEIKLVKSGTHTIVLLNSDADGLSELAFMVRNVGTLSSSDFVL